MLHRAGDRPHGLAGCPSPWPRAPLTLSSCLRGQFAKQGSAAMQTSKSFVRTARRSLFLAGLLILPLGGKLVAYGQEAPQRPAGTVTALVIMTPTGSATCATWVQWRSPGAHSADSRQPSNMGRGLPVTGFAAAVDTTSSGPFAAKRSPRGSTAIAPPIHNELPLAVNALGREMLAHPGGQL